MINLICCLLAAVPVPLTEVVSGSGFRMLDSGVESRASTSFELLASKEVLKARVICTSVDPARLRGWKNGSPDTIELFLAPEGNVQNYYQFCVDADGFRRAGYFEEKGSIQPDPYDPVWTAEVTTNGTGWVCEIAIPMTSFYMTRTANWKTDWLVNVTRNDRTGGGLSSWCRCLRSFHEPDSFKKVSGFPARDESRDAHVEMATMRVERQVGDGYQGNLRVRAMAAVAGRYVVRVENVGVSREQYVRANQFVNFDFPATYASTGRQRTKIVLKRLSDGYEFKRYYPVRVDYEPIECRLSRPEYRNNFYPGQDYSKIVGTAVSLAGGPVTLTLEGPGLPRSSQTILSGASFEFATPGFEIGTAQLEIAADGQTKVVPIRRLAPTGRMMTWISGGNLIVNGKPTFRRDFYAPFFNASAAWIEVYTNDTSNGLCLTREITRGGWLEPMRLMGGRAFEAKEVKKDVYPCRDYLDKIDKVLSAWKDKDFGYYYISDEPDVRGLSEVYLRHVYEYVKDRDPYHVILTATRTPAKYVDCADWFETHPYLDPHVDATGKRLYQHEMKDFGPYLDQIASMNRGDKCIGFVPTAFSYGFNSSFADYPTFDEYVCHVMTALAHGAKTLWPFAGGTAMSRPGMFEGIRWTFAFTKVYEDLLLHGKRTLLPSEPDRERCVWTLGDETLSIDLNMRSPFDVTCDYRGSRSRDIEALSVARARAAALEAERNDPCSLLVGRHDDIVLTVSGQSITGLGAVGRELFDGGRRTVAWTAPAKGDKWVELGFSTFLPEFRRVRISGEGLDGMGVKVWKNCAWLPLDGVVACDGYESLLTLPQTSKAVKLRVEFPSPAQTRLYEIELLSDSPPIVTPVTSKPLAFVRQWSVSNMEETVTMPYDPQKNWFVATLDEAVWEEHPTWRYHGWSVKVSPGIGTLASGGRTFPYATYMARLPDDSVTGEKKTVKARVIGHNYTLKFSDFGCVSKPSNRIEVNVFGKQLLTVGDEIEVTLTLAAPAEDVTCTLMGNQLNGSASIVLMKANEECTIWRSKLKINDIQNHQKRSNETFVVATVLGGALLRPLVTPVPARFE